ncbi:MAG: MFS transporter [Coriobacteriales bacterium]|nr:MFS transporter [Coriobacteriales bacterium]
MSDEINEAGGPRTVEPKRALPFFYGWLILLGCFLIMATCYTIFINCIPIFQAHIVQDLAISVGQFNTGVSLCTVVAIFASLAFGAIVDKVQARILGAFTVIVTAIVLILFSFINEIWQLYALCIIAGMIVVAGTRLLASVLATNWFTKHRALAVSIALSGSGFGGVLLSPLTTAVIDGYGWRPAFLLLAAICLIAALPLAIGAFYTRPSDKGLLPYGAEDNNKELLQSKPPVGSLSRDSKTTEGNASDLALLRGEPDAEHLLRSPQTIESNLNNNNEFTHSIISADEKETKHKAKSAKKKKAQRTKIYDEPVTIAVGWKVLRKRSGFWLLVLGFVMMGIVNGEVITNAVSNMTSVTLDGEVVITGGHDLAWAGWVWSLYLAVVIVGKVALGAIYDHFGLRAGTIVGTIACALASIALCFPATDWAPIVAAFTFGFGTCMGTVTPPVMVVKEYGKLDVGIITGIVTAFELFGAAIGAIVSGFFFDAFHSFVPAWLLALAAAIIMGVTLMGSIPAAQQIVARCKAAGAPELDAEGKEIVAVDA